MQPRKCRNCAYWTSIPPWQGNCTLYPSRTPLWNDYAAARTCPSYSASTAPRLDSALAESVGEYEITDPRTLQCDFCDQRCAGRIHFEQYGGHLMVCETCWALLQAKKSHPYSRVMDRFATLACGYYVNRKEARWPR